MIAGESPGLVPGVCGGVVLGMVRAMTQGTKHDKKGEGSVKDTVISMVISLAMALIAKIYVVEAFVIPTGSMAPTLLGQHMAFRSPETGYSWTVNPWYYSGQLPMSPQGVVRSGGVREFPIVSDPMTLSAVFGERIPANNMYPTGLNLDPREPVALRAGDRILVQKYLYFISSPKRWDVVVFKNPEQSRENYIKRLVGLPNEQVWLADGDVFVRERPADVDPGSSNDPGEDSEWSIARKPDLVQRELWRTIFSSEYTPLSPLDRRTGRRFFTTPWSGDGWETADRRVFRTDRAERTELAWDHENWPVTDWEAYNDQRRGAGDVSMRRQSGWKPVYPVSDVRLRAGVRPERADIRVEATVEARGHVFQGVLENGRALVRMREVGSDGAWTDLASGSAPGFRPGRVTNVEFWHVDQSLHLWVDGRRVVEGAYSWGPMERLLHSTGRHGSEYSSQNALSPVSLYSPSLAQISWSFEGSAVELHRVGLDRDVWYQPTPYYDPPQTNTPGFGTHPWNLATLGPDHFFVLGDNSPSSRDARMWTGVDRDVAHQIDDTRGVVHRKLMLGKAFYVYFPAPRSMGRIPIPDFGTMRWIR